MILYSRPIIEEKTYDLKDFFITQKSAYITILLFGDDKGSMIYVKNKIKYGGEIWCNVRVIKDEDFKSLKGKDLVNSIKEKISQLNDDKNCLGIIIQLPLPKHLQDHQQELCDTIAIEKDIDCMTSAMVGKISVGRKDIVYPAAVAATISLLYYYKLTIQKGKQVSIIGQSNLIGKPMALYAINQWAQVHSFWIDWDTEIMKKICQESDYIISSTGVLNLIDQECISANGKQVVIDIGYAFDEKGKAAGDANFYEIKDSVHALSPVPGGIGPLCVYQLFENIVKLHS
jgi:methylenetetrahydrofolate dehydrogenase (NADP+)/methenyltetrahydrofolate cyclohydrolase